VPVEHAEHDEAAPGEPLVSVEKRVIAGDAHRKDGCLVEELGVHVASAKRCLRSVKSGIEKVDPRTSNVDTNFYSRRCFGNCECFGQAQIPH
jgi:hypothetical protein